MPNPQKQNASGKGGAKFTKVRAGVNEQNKTSWCGNHHITRLRKRLRAEGLLLSSTKTESQLEALIKILRYRGEAGISTPEGVGIGFARLATRVFDLESRGWRIDTIREDVVTADGLKHRGIARYILRGRRADFIDPQGSLDLGAA